jgi:hypothetical protein
MILIIKRQLHEECFILRISEYGYLQEDKDYVRLFEIIDQVSLDKILYRKKLYMAIIDRLIISNKWNRNRSYQESDVTNTLHKWIVECFELNKIMKFFIEVDERCFR